MYCTSTSMSESSRPIRKLSYIDSSPDLQSLHIWETRAPRGCQQCGFGLRFYFFAPACCAIERLDWGDREVPATAAAPGVAVAARASLLVAYARLVEWYEHQRPPAAAVTAVTAVGRQWFVSDRQPHDMVQMSEVTVNHTERSARQHKVTAWARHRYSAYDVRSFIMYCRTSSEIESRNRRCACVCVYRNVPVPSDLSATDIL